MQEELITAALVNGLCKAWGEYKAGPELFAAGTASMTLLAVRPLGVDFGVHLEGEIDRVYRLDLVVAQQNADIALVRTRGNPEPDNFDDRMTELLLSAFETTVSPAVRFAGGPPVLPEVLLATMPAASPLLH